LPYFCVLFLVHPIAITFFFMFFSLFTFPIIALFFVSFLGFKVWCHGGYSWKLNLFHQASIGGWLFGWIFLKVYHQRWKVSNSYCNFFFRYILIPIKTNESKNSEYFRSTTVWTITILDSIIIIHKCVFTW
jgi:hypothetical protein